MTHGYTPAYDREVGAIMGLALGDALCAPYEGGVLERLLWRCMAKKAGKQRWTDDTQMTIDIMESLIEKCGLDQDHLACVFAESYRWTRGYGPGAARLLKRIKKGVHWSEANRSVFADGSFGNGAAMRVAPLCVFYQSSREALQKAVHESALITHAHVLAVEGARIVAAAIAHALEDREHYDYVQAASDVAQIDVYVDLLETARVLRGDTFANTSAKKVATTLGNGIAAIHSCVTAIYCAQRFSDQPFLEMLGFIQKIGGDTDTIAAMAGSIWGASNGLQKLPQDRIHEMEDAEKILALAQHVCEIRNVV